MRACELPTQRGRRLAGVFNACAHLRVVTALGAALLSTVSRLVAEPSVALELVGSWSSPEVHASAVRLAGGYAYLASGHGLEVLDVTNPSLPVRVAGVIGRYAYGLDIVGNHLFLADTYPGGFSVIDISDPTAPVRIGGTSIPDGSTAVRVRNGYAYSAGEGLKIFDVNRPAQPVWVGQYDDAKNGYRLQVVNNRAYIAAGFAGFFVIDVSDPSRPSSLGCLRTNHPAYDVDIAGEFAFVAYGGNPGLRIFDVSNPAQITLVGTNDVGGYAWGVQVVDHYAFVASHDSGLRVVDISNPAQPVLVGAFATGAWARGVHVSGDLAAVAASEAGVLILKITYQPLRIVLHPVSQSIEHGHIAVLNVHAVSTAPLQYQWQRNGTNLFDGLHVTGVRTSQLTISNTSALDEGAYAVVVSNQWGSITSSNALLTVGTALWEALDATNLVWTYWPPWHAQTNITQDGVDAAESSQLRSGIVAETTWLETSVQGPGLVSFWWRAAAASDQSTNADFCYTFSTGGVPRANVSEENFHNDWQQVVLPISVATTDSTKLRWQFSTLGGCTDPAVGTAWLDHVSFTPEWPDIALIRLTQTNLTLLLKAPLDGRFEIQQSTNFLHWETPPGLGPVQLQNGEATVQVPTPDSPRCFYRLLWVQ